MSLENSDPDVSSGPTSTSLFSSLHFIEWVSEYGAFNELILSMERYKIMS